MDLTTKQRILKFIENTPETPENKEERSELLKKMRNEVCFIDINTHSVCTEDLENYYDQNKLRRCLGKAAEEPYTIDDCATVSEAVAETICEEFGEDLENAISWLEEQE